MERNLLEIAKNRNFVVDLEIEVPASKEEEFSKNYEKRGWSSENKGNKTIFYPNTVSVRTARSVCSKLPKYAKVSEIYMFPKNPDASYFYKGPMVVGPDGLIDFLESRVRLVESKLDTLEKNS